MKPIFCWIALLAVAQSCLLLGADGEYARRSLAGITSLTVLVEELPAAAVNLGLTKEALQTDVELKLRLAGMKIESTAPAMLYVNLNVGDDGSAANIVVELDQSVVLARNPSIMVWGVATWSTSVLVTNTNASGIRGDTKDLVDAFLNAWLSVNPKR